MLLLVLREWDYEWLCFPSSVFSIFVMYITSLFQKNTIFNACHEESSMPADIHGKLKRNVLSGPWFPGAFQLLDEKFQCEVIFS